MKNLLESFRSVSTNLYFICSADGHRVPLCHVVVGGYAGALGYINRAVSDNFPLLILKVF